mgnify:CR=1 FL=1
MNIFFHHKIPVFVGFGSCIDIFVSATKLFKEIGLQPPDGSKEYGVLNDESQFKEEFFFGVIINGKGLTLMTWSGVAVPFVE